MHDIKALLLKALVICDKENIPYRKITGIKVNNRLSKSWGRCNLDTKTGSFSIELRNVIADDSITPEKGTLEIILHEVIHTCEGCFNHGALFNAYGERLLKYGYDTQGRTKNKEKLNLNMTNYMAQAKYICKCQKCGFEETRQRMCKFVKEPENFLHKHCGGTFMRIK